MIFAVICLTLLATLSLLTAKHEMTLSDKYTSSIDAYYTADSKAVQSLQKIYNSLTQASELYANKEDQMSYLKQQCKNYDFNCEAKDDILYISYAEEIDNTQTLKVIIKITSIPDKTYEIMQWKKINTHDFIIDDTIDVYK
jgi:hypothetical protein